MSDDRLERIRGFAERVADYVESGEGFAAMTPREAMMEAVRVACVDAFEDLWKTLCYEFEFRFGSDCG